MQKVEQFVAEIDNSIRALYKPKAPSKRDNNWASDLHHPCKRNLVYARMNWKDRQLVSIESEYRFKEGRTKELETRQLLEQAGFQVESVQDYFTWDKYSIAGRIDGLIVDKDRNKYPLEIKSVSPWFWDSTKSIKDIKRHKKFWINKIVSQLNIYLFMAEKEFGILALTTFGKIPRILPMAIDYELGEEDVKAAEFVNDCVKEGIMPMRLTYDPAICGLCSFEHICQPVKIKKMDADMVIDENMRKMLCRYFELKPDAKEYDQLKKRLIGSQKAPGIFHGSDILIDDIEISTKEYDMVQKAREEKKIYIVRTTIGKIDTE